MAFNLENMTIDYKKMLKMIPSDRATLAQSGAVNDLISSLTPGQLVNLFPRYYRDQLPDVGNAVSSLGGALSGGSQFSGGGRGGGGGGGYGSTSSPNPSPGLKRTLTIEERSLQQLYEEAKVGQYDGLPKGKVGLYRPSYELSETDLSDDVIRTIAGEARLSSKEGIDAVINVMLNRVGSDQYGSNLSDVARQGYGTSAVQFEGYNKGKPSKEQADYIRERIKILASGAEPDNTYGANEFRGDYYVFGEGRGKDFYRDAEKQGFVNIGGNIFAARGNYSGPHQGYGKDDVEKRLAELEKNKDSGETATQFDPALLEKLDDRYKKYYERADIVEKRRMELTIERLGSDRFNEIMKNQPINDATLTATSRFEGKVGESSAADFYKNVRGQYPDKIDINSDIWNQVDPELAKARNSIVDAETGLVGRDALLAADASSKVLRKNNYIPRIASGGDNHSENHGSGRDANYSIDLSASVVNDQGKVVPINLGKNMPEQIKNDMATAAHFASLGAEGGHRVGYPDKSSPNSMHIQQDPARGSAYWGYSKTGVETSKLSTLQATEEGRRFLQERETISRLTPEQAANYFDSITGFTPKEKAVAPQPSPTNSDPVTSALSGVQGSPSEAIPTPVSPIAPVTIPPDVPPATPVTTSASGPRVLSIGGTVEMPPGENVLGINTTTGKTEFVSNDRELYTKDDQGNLRVDPSTIRQNEPPPAQIAQAETQRLEKVEPLQRRPQQPMPADTTDPYFADTMSSGSMASSPSQLRALNRAKLYNENSSSLVNGHFS